MHSLSNALAADAEPRGAELDVVRLGPGRAVEVDGRRVLVEREGARRWATMALAYPYEPVVGDVLLLLGDARDAWVVGVVEGRGRVDLRFEGDVTLHAAGGALTLAADRGVRVRGPELDVAVERVQTVATTVVEKCATLYQRVREMLSVHAKESHTIVEETALSRAKKVAVVAEETASVNGKQILLG
ncbi:MAG TPA: DUF3540 domain-containing protein [Minicystis sp.]|nr:DUF3540 domain-containing protein [Minicystis sp.]